MFAERRGRHAMGVNDKFAKLTQYLSNYQGIRIKKRERLIKATEVSVNEIISRIEEVVDTPKPLQLVGLLKTLTNSGVWISRSMLHYLIATVDFSTPIKEKRESERVQYILDKIINNEDIQDPSVTEDEIFKTIYNELEFAHHNKNYNTELKVPKLDVTIVLVSGVLNEIFSTPAFERGAEHLQETLGIKFFSPKTKGTKGARTNVRLIEKQLLDYVANHKDEKLWLLAFSKGGIDCLHFLEKNKEFSNRHISGLSCIASPILGSNYTEHRILKLINKVHFLEGTKIYKMLEKEKDFLYKEIYQSLRAENQKKWFEKHHKNLPSKLFYTATAFEAAWYESHLWMILTKIFFKSAGANDGVVEADQAKFPEYFPAHNLGVIRGHHLVGTRSSMYSQEALLEAHLIYLSYKKLIS
ncbi:MAG: hypothetical protein EP326_15225 [Deltaproteobacteria bacterium]|nr:MAG: hypothetical protein EP326_15225 [Deltaproteobacteria bacterium]